MKIERVTFLALTAAIAAACSTTKEPVAPVIVPEDAPDASHAGGRPKTIEEIVADGGGTPVVSEAPDASASREGFPAACSLDGRLTRTGDHSPSIRRALGEEMRRRWLAIARSLETVTARAGRPIFPCPRPFRISHKMHYVN